MENLVSNSKYFKFNPKINREPVEIRKNRYIKPRFTDISLLWAVCFVTGERKLSHFL